MTNPFAFIVGNPRSGTTLLRHILDSHSQVAFLLESAWFMNWFEKRMGLSSDGLVTPKLVPILLSKHRLFRDVELGISQEEIYRWIQADPDFSWAKFISTLCNRYGQARGKPLVGNKTPSFVRRIRAMHELWPQTKFIHIIRDGRDVFLSARVKWKDKPDFRHYSTWSQDNVTTAALWWEWNVRLGREAGCLLPQGLYYEMRYEHLVEDPENECIRLCDFLGVPFESAMLRHEETFQLRHRADGGAINARVALPITPGLRNWRSELEAAELQRFEAAAGALLSELSYPLGCGQVPAGNLQYAMRIRGLFEGRPLPQHWGTRSSD